MQMLDCPNCGGKRGFKRSFGFGTLLAVLLTVGLLWLAGPLFWLFLFPLLVLWLLFAMLRPARCITCGLSRSAAYCTNFVEGWKKWRKENSVAASQDRITGQHVLAVAAFVACGILFLTWATEQHDGRLNNLQQASPSVRYQRPREYVSVPLPESRLGQASDQAIPAAASPNTQKDSPFQDAEVYASAEQLMIDRQTGAQPPKSILGKSSRCKESSIPQARRKTRLRSPLRQQAVVPFQAETGSTAFGWRKEKEVRLRSYTPEITSRFLAGLRSLEDTRCRKNMIYPVARITS